MKLTTKQLKQMIKEELGLIMESSDCDELESRYNELNWREQNLVDRFKDLDSSSWSWQSNDIWAAANGDESIRQYYPGVSEEEFRKAAKFLDDWFSCKDTEQKEKFDVMDYLGEWDWIAYKASNKAKPDTTDYDPGVLYTIIDDLKSTDLTLEDIREETGMGLEDFAKAIYDAAREIY